MKKSEKELEKDWEEALKEDATGKPNEKKLVGLELGKKKMAYEKKIKNVKKEFDGNDDKKNNKKKEEQKISLITEKKIEKKYQKMNLKKN